VTADRAADLWKLLPKAMGGLAAVATGTAAIAHQPVEVWDVAFYLGMACLWSGLALFPSVVVGTLLESIFEDANSDLIWFGTIAFFALFFTASTSAVYNPHDTDTMGRVTISAIGVTALIFALYKADQAKTKAAEPADPG
jgi:hypothetical protein